MKTFAVSIATTVSRFSWLAAITLAACGSSGTSLDGPTPCGSSACRAGELCMTAPPGIDAGAGGGDIYECFAVPDGCAVVDCVASGCATCIRDLCFTGATGFGISVAGRNMTCPGG
jgi:hypothetical protein